MRNVFFWSLVAAIAGLLFGFDTVVISEAKIEEKKLNQLEESDKKKIKKLLKTKTTKNIVEIINEKKNIKKKIIYDYCLKLKNETN